MEAPVINKGGRPLGSTKYTREELQQKIDAYFADVNNKPYSVLELCYVLGVTRETLREWTENEDKGLSDLVIRAKYRIGAGWEKGEKIHPKLAELLLKNHFGYTDKQEINVNNRLSVEIAPQSLEQIEAALRLSKQAETVALNAAQIIEGEVLDVKTEPI